MGRDTYFAYSGNNLSPAGGTHHYYRPRRRCHRGGLCLGGAVPPHPGLGDGRRQPPPTTMSTPTLATTAVTDPDGHTTTYTYDADGDVLTKEDAARQDLDLHLQLARRGAHLPDPRPGRGGGRDDEHLRR